MALFNSKMSKEVAKVKDRFLTVLIDENTKNYFHLLEICKKAKFKDYVVWE